MWPFPARPLPGKPRYLNRMQCGTVARFAEAVIPVDEPEASPEEIALELDRFLSVYHSRRKWRIKYVVLGLEFIPLLAGRPPLSLMSLADRRRFVTEKLRTCHGLWGKVAMGKQLVLLAYYGLQRSNERMGFVPFMERERAERLLAAAPQPGERAS
jgi:hypothetical protein